MVTKMATLTDKSMRNKLCIVTGSARGLGKGFVIALLKEGAFVTISDILEPEGLDTASDLAKTFGADRVHFVVCDVTKEESFKALWDESEKHFGRPVDVLVNNAGINHLNHWKKLIDVNLIGVMTGSYLAVERMGRRSGGSGGLVINSASMAGLAPTLDYPSCSYHVSKAGVVQLTKSLGQEFLFKDEGVRFACLCPSFTDTDMIRVFADMEYGKHAKRLFGENGIMAVEKVVDAFVHLVKDGRNGAALCVLPDMPHIYFPLVEQRTTEVLAVGAKIAEKVFGIEVFRPWQQVVFVVVAMFVIVHFMEFVIGILAKTVFGL